jgi:hypothetical protein
MNVESYRRRAALERKRSRGPPAGPRDNHGKRLLSGRKYHNYGAGDGSGLPKRRTEGKIHRVSLGSIGRPQNIRAHLQEK